MGLVLLIAVTAAMQAALALRSGLWADEIFSLAMATGHSMEHPAAAAEPARGDFVETAEPVGLAELQRYLRMEEGVSTAENVLRAVKLSDTSPPLYYLLLHGWLRVVGTSDFALRAFAMVAALACVPLVFWIARETRGERAGWLAAVLFAAAPMTSYYGTEARMYPLLWLCVLAVAAATLRMARGQSGAGVSAIWIGASAAGLLVHYYFVFAWGALAAGWGAMALMRSQGSRIVAVRRAGWHVLGALALAAPWYVQLPDVFAQWRITQEWVTWKSQAYSVPKVAADSLTRWFAGDGNYLWRPHRKAGAAALLVFAVSAVAMLWRERRKTFAQRECLILAWLFAAAWGPLAVDALRGTFIAEFPRYGSPALPAACVLGGWILASWSGWRSGVALVAVLVCWMPSLRSVHGSDSRSWQPTKEAARRVSVGARAGDLVLIQSVPTGALSLARYLTTPAEAAVWVEQLGQRRLPESLQTLIRGKHAVWLVTLHTVGASAAPEEWLREQGQLAGEQRVGNIAIREFLPRDGGAF